jgi:DNA invertase Pin-like site-specific DNA recombinase
MLNCLRVKDDRGIASRLAPCWNSCRASDVLMVTRIDRLARSIGDLQDIVRTIRANGRS